LEFEEDGLAETHNNALFFLFCHGEFRGSVYWLAFLLGDSRANRICMDKSAARMKTLQLGF
jgi:hypothetical protein